MPRRRIVDRVAKDDFWLAWTGKENTARDVDRTAAGRAVRAGVR